jgi:hypothetical protein
MLSNLAFATPEDMNFGGVDYLGAKDDSVTYRGDFWRTGTQIGDLVLPLREKWTKQIGKSYSQVVASGDCLYTLADNNIVQVNTKTKAVKKLKIQASLTPSSSGITVIKNNEGWFNADKLDRLIFGTTEGKVYCYKVKDSEFQTDWLDWTFDTRSGKDITTNPAFLFDSVTKVPYLTFASENNFYIVDSKGNLIQESKENGKIVSAPLIFQSNVDEIHSDFLYGVNAKTPYFVSGTVIGGQFFENPLFNKDVKNDYEMDGIAGITSEAVNIGGIPESVLVTVDKKGNVFCINMRTSDLLWEMSKYAQSTSNPSYEKIAPNIDENYVYVTLPDVNGKAKFFAIDYRRAIDLGKSNPKSSATNAAVVNLSNDDEFTGVSKTNNLIVRIMKTNEKGDIDIRGRVAFVGDTGENNNLRVFYTNETDGGRAVKVNDAFETYNEETNQKTTSTYFTLKGGLASDVSYIGGYVYLVDGAGYLHAFSGTAENNLSVLNIKNTFLDSKDLQDTVQKGKTYQIEASLANYFGKDTAPVDIVFQVEDDKNIIKKENVIIPADGLTINLKYTVPLDYDSEYFNIKCTVNPASSDGKRKVEEIKYTDNYQILQIKVAKDLDIETTDIKINEYYENSYVSADVTVKNNSSQDMQNVPLSLYVDGKKLPSTQVANTFSIAKGASLSVPLTVFLNKITPDENKKTQIRAIANESKAIQEINDINNNAKTWVNAYRDLPDFEAFELIDKPEFATNTKVTTLFRVRNISRNDYDSVDVVFTANGVPQTKTIPLKANSEKLLNFEWTTPANECTVDLIAVINPNQKIKEKLGSDGKAITDNNIKTTKATIKSIPPPKTIPETKVDIKPVPQGSLPDHKEWTESRFDHWEYQCVGSSVGTGYNDDGSRYTFSIPIYQWVAIYKTYSFYADLKLSISRIIEDMPDDNDRINPASVKSGYGINVIVTSNLTTNYDRLNNLTGVQQMSSYFPESDYSVSNELESFDSVNKLSNTWQFRVNSESVLGSNVHFIPIWFPDAQNYTIQFIGRGVQTPAGTMSATVNANIPIQGNMYDDERTGSAR